MMEFVSQYIAHQPDKSGFIAYSPAEHLVWQTLFTRQLNALPQIACSQFLQGLQALGLSSHCIPQLPEINQRLTHATGWSVAPVEALISARDFFTLLASKRFPVATFIRSMEELDYVKEPDIFHEIFGHCPMLTHTVYAEFIHQFACTVLSLPEKDWPLLQRLFWFTVEFGLIKSEKGLRAYGGGILSSISEAAYSVQSDVPVRVLFEPLTAFRTPYRIDKLQVVYFVIDSYETLYQLVKQDLAKLIKRAYELGELPALFTFDSDNPHIHILAC